MENLSRFPVKDGHIIINSMYNFDLVLQYLYSKKLMYPDDDMIAALRFYCNDKIVNEACKTRSNIDTCGLKVEEKRKKTEWEIFKWNLIIPSAVALFVGCVIYTNK